MAEEVTSAGAGSTLRGELNARLRVLIDDYLTASKIATGNYYKVVEPLEAELRARIAEVAPRYNDAMSESNPLDIDVIAKTVVVPFDADYREQITPLTDDYEAKIAPFVAALRAMIAPLFDEYEAKRAPVDADFKERIGACTAEYDAGVYSLYADIAARDKVGQTALMFAVMDSERTDVIKAILAVDQNINARDMEGQTALMYAAADNKNPDVIESLMKAGADVGARTKDGLTPLMFAALRNQNPDVIVSLLDAGADATAKDRNGQTVFDYAKRNEELRGTDVYGRLKSMLS